MRNDVPQTKEEYDEAVVRRVEALLEDMGWEPKDLAKRIYERVGYKSPKAAEHWFMRKGSRRLSSFAILVIADTLGVASSYINLEHDNLEDTMDPDGQYALRRQVRRLGG